MELYFSKVDRDFVFSLVYVFSGISFGTKFQIEHLVPIDIRWYGIFSSSPNKNAFSSSVDKLKLEQLLTIFFSKAGGVKI